MMDYLRTIFGEDIKQESFQYPVGTPNYIRNGYKAWCFSWDIFQRLPNEVCHFSLRGAGSELNRFHLIKKEYSTWR